MLKEYNFISANKILLNLFDGQTALILLDALSGNMVFRKKGDSLLNVQHTGIYLGKCQKGISYVIHSHPNNGEAIIESIKGFSLGYPVFKHHQNCSNTLKEVLGQALQAVINRLAYSIFVDNCQHLSFSACYSSKESPDLDRIFTSTGSILSGLALLNSKNNLFQLVGILALAFGVTKIIDSSIIGQRIS